METFLRLWKYLADIFLIWEVSQTKFVEDIKTHILRSMTFLKKSRRLWDNVARYGTARRASPDNKMLSKKDGALRAG